MYTAMMIIYFELEHVNIYSYSNNIVTSLWQLIMSYYDDHDQFNGCVVSCFVYYVQFCKSFKFAF